MENVAAMSEDQSYSLTLFVVSIHELEAKGPRNQRDGDGSGRRAEGVAWGAWLAPDPRDARGALYRRAIALGDARALWDLKNCGGRSRDRAERRNSLWAVSGELPL
ncbi:hypothetical protein NDU88_001251 [Pleurodeles waltl]|uniref:Uncharacterized protein n=1 Tax=Pleurodeles waltl TaxID=8319 RepID=A0AAV7UST2_PLEWA|nr:hypothetical protein NDU88_001251 [Pleurodeles waltl]